MSALSSSSAAPKFTFTMDPVLLAKCLKDGTYVEFDSSIYEGADIKIREYPDGSKTFGNSKIITQADKNGLRYMFNYSGCSIIAIFENVPASQLANQNAKIKGNILDTHFGIRSPAGIVEYMLTLGAFTKDFDFENIGRTLPQDADSMLDHEHIHKIGEILGLGITVVKLNEKNIMTDRIAVIKGEHATTIRLKNLHYLNSGDQASF